MTKLSHNLNGNVYDLILSIFPMHAYSHTVKLGPMLVQTGMDDDSFTLLQSHFHNFLKCVRNHTPNLTWSTRTILLYRFLEKSQELFTMEYDAAPQEYHRRCT